MSLDTAEVVDVALEQVGWDELPGDSTIYVEGSDLETALVGIDIGTAELHLAHREGYDLALAHHPAGGNARLEFADVLEKQVEFMTDHGVPTEEAREAVATLRENAIYGAHASNYRHAPSVAELLELPFVNVHLPPDEVGRRAFVEVIESLGPDATAAEVGPAFEEAFPAFRDAETDVEVRVGDPDDPLGEVAVHHAAGTNGGADVARAYFEHGVDTVLYIHVDAGDARELREEFGDEKTLIVTGHIASDAVGMARYVSALEERSLECTTISGCGLGR